jgi:hypothetical protein
MTADAATQSWRWVDVCVETFGERNWLAVNGYTGSLLNSAPTPYLPSSFHSKAATSGGISTLVFNFEQSHQGCCRSMNTIIYVGLLRRCSARHDLQRMPIR